MADRKVTISLFGDDRDLDQKIADAKRKIDDLKAKGAKIPIGLEKAKFDQDVRAAEIKLDELNRKKASPKIDTTKASLELDRLDLGIDKTSLKLDKLALKDAPEAGTSLTQFGSNLGAMSNFAIPALIAGLTMLAGQATVVAFGLGGIGAAAFHDLDPLFQASQKAGGLAANLKDLDPAQKKAASSLLVLSDDYSKFSKALEPEVFDTFNKGLGLADHLMSDVGPIAKEAGNGLTSVLGSIDKEFQNGTWQEFFGFMEKNAEPDIKQLGMLFTDLLQAIPPLAEAMHPLGQVLINDLDDVVKFTGGLSALLAEVEKSASLDLKLGSGENGTGNRVIQNVKNAIGQVLNPVQAVMNEAGKAGNWLDHLFGGSDKAAAGQNKLAMAAKSAALAAAAEQRSMDSLATALGNVIDKTLTLQGTEVSWKQAQQDATKAINANKNSLDGNSQSALAAKQAIISSTQAALSAAQAQIHLSHNTQGASDIISKQIQYLENHASKSAFATREVQALIQAEFRIPHSISSAIHLKSAAAAAALAAIMNRMAALNGMTSTVYVDYSVGGKSYVVPHHRKAAGGLIPGSGNEDNYPALLTPGEAVVPKRLVPAVAPFLKAHGVPGFADGGFAGPGFSMPSFNMPPTPSISPGGTQHIVLEFATADNGIISALANAIRVKGGSAEILTRKVKFA